MRSVSSSGKSLHSSIFFRPSRMSSTFANFSERKVGLGGIIPPNPTLRSEKFANVEDILDGLKKIDECNDFPLLDTDRMDVIRQLKIGTKVLSSLSVAEKVAEFDHDLKFLEDTIASAALDCVSRHGRLLTVVFLLMWMLQLF